MRQMYAVRRQAPERGKGNVPSHACGCVLASLEQRNRRDHQAYERPEAAEIVLDAGAGLPEALADQVIAALEARDIIQRF